MVSEATSERPPRSTWVLLALITGAIVSNINLSIANVALPTIGRDLGASQDELTQIANAFALGLASTVLYLGAVGDRYGRKLLFVIGCTLTIPTALLAAYAPNATVLGIARLLGGVAAAMLFPTTLSIISALFNGGAKVTAIALWAGLGTGVAALGPLIGGWLLESYWWGSVFLISLPLVIVALLVGLIVLPWRAHEEVFVIDHAGGVLSVVAVGGLVLAIERFSGGITTAWLVTAGIGVAGLIAFFLVQRRVKRPLVDLSLASARTFWVAFVAGAITFGSLIGAMFIGQQFTQNVLGYDTFTAALVVVPAAITTAIGGQLAGRFVNRRGSRPSLLIGLAFVAAAFVVMLVTWRDGASMGWILLGYALVGAGVGFAATPASRALMGSVPAVRAGMGSGFLDLTRDLGGAIIQALMGAALAGAYARRMTADLDQLPASEASQVSDQVADQLTSSFASASDVAAQYPASTASDIISAASEAFTSGKSLAIALALTLTVIGLFLVLFVFPRKAAEESYYAQVQGVSPDESGNQQPAPAAGA